MTTKKVSLLLTITALIVSLIALIFSTNVVGVSRKAPDHNDFGAGEDVFMIVAKRAAGSYLEAPTSGVVFYFQNPTGSVEIFNGATNCAEDYNTGASTNYSFYKGGDPNVGGFISTVSSTDLSCTWTTAVNMTGLPPVTIGTQTYYTAFMEAKHMGSSGVNAFKVRGPVGSIASFYHVSGNWFSLQDRDKTNSPAISNFTLKYGYDCSATATQNLEWFDDDEDIGVGGNWSQNQASYKQRVKEIRIFDDVETGNWVLENGTGSSPPTSVPYSETFPAGVDFSNRTTPSGDTIGWTSDNYAGYIRKLQFKLGHRYEWIWEGVADANGISFQIPANSIYSEVDCNEGAWEYKPRFIDTGNDTDNGTVVRSGDTIRVVGDVENIGDTDGQSYDFQILASLNGSYVNSSDLTAGGSWTGGAGKIASWNSLAGIPASDPNGPNFFAEYTVKNSAVEGDEICFKARVKPFEEGSGATWRETDPDVFERCYPVGGDSSENWEYLPSFLESDGATPSQPKGNDDPALFIPRGGTIRLVSQVENVYASGTGPNYDTMIRPNVNGDSVDPKGNPLPSNSCSWLGNPKFARCNNRPGLPAGASSYPTEIRIAEYTVRMDAPTGLDYPVCFVTGVFDPGDWTPSGSPTVDEPEFLDWRWDARKGSTPRKYQRCYIITEAGPTGWNYLPRFTESNLATSIGTLVSPGFKIRLVSDVYNNFSGAGAAYDTRIKPVKNSSYIDIFIDPSNPSTGGIWEAGDTARWNGRSGLSGNTDSPDRYADYIVNASALPGEQICFVTDVNPFAGTSNPPIPTSSGWRESSQRCFTVAGGGGGGNYDYRPTVNVIDSVQRGNTFEVDAEIKNDDTGVQPFKADIFLSNGDPAFVGRETGLSTPGYFPPAGSSTDTYNWSHPGIGSAGDVDYTGGYKALNVTNALGRDLLCFKAGVEPAEGVAGGAISLSRRESAEACIDVYDKFKFEIVDSGGLAVAPGQIVDITINNVGTGPGANPWEWSVTGTNVVSDSGKEYYSIPPISTGSHGSIEIQISNSASFGDTVCADITVKPGSGRVFNELGTDFEVDDVEVTTKAGGICFEIVERPYLEVHGGDLLVGGVFAPAGDPLNCVIAGGGGKKIRSVRSTTEGSFGEYGVFATGGIFSFGSQGNFNGASLTFANNTTPLGNFSTDGYCIPNYYDLFYDGATTVSNYNASLDGQYFVGRSDRGIKDLKLTSPFIDIVGGIQQIILVNGDVDIKSNIRFNYNVSNRADVPFFMVVATGNININHTVDRLDGIYFAFGEIDTCSDAPDKITIGPGVTHCNSKLTINGAFIANKMNFKRAEGGLLRGGPAEVFNFSPEVYLGAPDVDTTIFGDLTPDQFKDLPPVY